MNAFHPDYIKTYHPQFLNAFRKEITVVEDNKKKRTTRQSVTTKGWDIKMFPKTRGKE